jgi:hypothetical protein
MTGYVPLKGIADSDFNIASIEGRSVRSLQMLGHCRGEISSCMGPERKMKKDNHRTWGNSRCLQHNSHKGSQVDQAGGAPSLMHHLRKFTYRVVTFHSMLVRPRIR